MADPIAYCFRLDASPLLFALHVFADALIWLAYMLISAALLKVYFVVHKRVPFSFEAIGFAAFIFLCGLTHLAAIGVLWWPWYRAQVALSIVTGVVSIYVAYVVLWKFNFLLGYVRMVDREVRGDVPLKQVAQWMKDLNRPDRIAPILVLAFGLTASQFALAEVDVPTPALAVAISTDGMTGDQKFYLSLAGIGVSVVLPLLSFWQAKGAMKAAMAAKGSSDETHDSVNGQMDAFRKMIREVSALAVKEQIALLDAAAKAKAAETLVEAERLKAKAATTAERLVEDTAERKKS